MKGRYLKYQGTYNIMVKDLETSLVKWNIPHNSYINVHQNLITITNGRIRQYSNRFFEFSSVIGSTRFNITADNIICIRAANTMQLWTNKSSVVRNYLAERSAEFREQLQMMSNDLI